MIIRILGEGQFDVPDAAVDQLNVHDERLEAAVEAGDDEQFAVELAALLNEVRGQGSPVPDADLVTSSLVLPASDSSLEEVRDLLSSDGLIPGRAPESAGD